MKVPAPPGEDRKRQGGIEDDDISNSASLTAATTPTAVKYGRKARISSKPTTTSPSPLLKAGSSVKKKKNVTKKKVVLMSTREREEMKGKMMSIKKFFMKLSDDPKLEQVEGDDRVRHRMRADDERSMMRDTDDDDGHDDKVVDTVCDDNLGILDKVSGSLVNTNLLCTETVRGDIVCVRGCEDSSRDQELQEKDVYNRQGEEKGLVLGECEDGGDHDEELLRDRRLLSVDQNQTLGGWVGQMNRQTLQGKILLKEGDIQRGILTEHYAKDVQHHDLASQTDNFDDPSG